MGARPGVLSTSQTKEENFLNVVRFRDEYGMSDRNRAAVVCVLSEAELSPARLNKEQPGQWLLSVTG